MHAEITVRIQSNKIVTMKVDNEALLQPSYRKKLNELFDQPNTNLTNKWSPKPEHHWL